MFTVLILLFALQALSQTALPIGRPVSGVITRGGTFSYFSDIDPDLATAARFVTADIELTDGVGFYKVQLKYGTGTLYDETRPSTNYYKNSFRVSSERVAGDISGRWYTTVTSCNGCTNTTTTSTYVITISVHNFQTERQIVSTSPQSTYTLGDSWSMWYFDFFDPTPSVIEISWKRTSVNGSTQVYIGRDFLPTSSAYTATAPNGNNFYVLESLLATQLVQVGYPTAGRWYIGFTGCDCCNSCTSTTPSTVANFDFSITIRHWDSYFNLGSRAGSGTLAMDQWDFYYVDLPGDTQHVAAITLQNASLGAFKVYTRKAQFPTSSTYTSMVPSGTTYSGNITVNIIPQSTDLGGRWYIGVRFCKTCNSQNTPYLGSYNIQAAVTLRGKVVESNYFDKETAAESVNLISVSPISV